MNVLALGGSPSPLWYATRATGVLALLLLTAGVVLGLLTTVRFATPRWPRTIIFGLHRNISLLVLAFLAVHILTAIADSFAPIGWADAVVPFVSAYRPLWLGLGTVAFDLLLAVAATSLWRTRLGLRSWKIVHWTAYACWPLALTHALGTGTDTRLSWMLGLNGACAAAVLVTLWWRLAAGWPSHSAVRLTSAAASVVTPIVLGAWLVTGPLVPGWAARSGTPEALLGHSATADRQTSSGAGLPPDPTRSGRLPDLPLTAHMAGTVTESQPDADGQVTVHIHATTAGTVHTVLDMRLVGQPDPSGGVAMSASQVTWGPAGDPHRYRGQVTALQGDHLEATVADGNGNALTLATVLRIDGHDVTGTLRVTQPGGDNQ